MSTLPSKTMQALLWAKAQTKPFTIEAMHAAVAPKEPIKRFRGLLSGVIRAERMVRVAGGYGTTTFRLSPTAFVDRRSTYGRKLGEPAQPRLIMPDGTVIRRPADKPMRASPGATKAAKAPKPAPPAKAQKPARVAPVDPLKLADSPLHKARASDLIAADVQRFLKAGGRIEQLANGVVSQPLKMSIREVMSQDAAVAMGKHTGRARRSAANAAL